MMRTTALSAAIVLAWTPLAGAAPAHAQDRAATPPPVAIGEIAACRALTADAERLACFDRATARLADAIARKEVVVLDQAEVKRTRRSLFGFAIPRLGFLRGNGRDGDDEPEFRELNATIRTARDMGNGNWQFGIEDATWQTTEPLRFPPDTGARVTIKRGVMGSYFLSVNGGRAVRAIRVR